MKKLPLIADHRKVLRLGPLKIASDKGHVLHWSIERLMSTPKPFFSLFPNSDNSSGLVSTYWYGAIEEFPLEQLEQFIEDLQEVHALVMRYRNVKSVP